MRNQLAALSGKARRVRLERGTPDDLFVAKLAKVKLDLAKKLNQEAKDENEFADRLRENLASGGWTNYIQICAPFELYALTRLLKPRHIVEVGVSAGVSSAYLLLGLCMNSEGILHSIDLPERQEGPVSAKDNRWGSWALPRGKEPGWAVPHEVRKKWDLHLGKSSDVLPGLISEIDLVDLFLYDVPYEIEEAIEDFKVVDQKLGSGSIVIADNCSEPIKWWAGQRRRATIYNRKNSGLRGFRIKGN